MRFLVFLMFLSKRTFYILYTSVILIIQHLMMHISKKRIRSSEVNRISQLPKALLCECDLLSHLSTKNVVRTRQNYKNSVLNKGIHYVILWD